jgi:hypothetical protein
MFFICKTDYSKPVKQEVNGTLILPLLVFPGKYGSFVHSLNNGEEEGIYDPRAQEEAQDVAQKESS